MNPDDINLIDLVARLSTKVWSRLFPPGSCRDRVYKGIRRPFLRLLLWAMRLVRGKKVVLPVRPAASIAEPAFPARPSPARLLIVKMDYIRDFLQGQAAYAALRHAFPGTEISLLCGPWNSDLAEASGLFDKIYAYPLLPSPSGGEGQKYGFDRASLDALGLPAFDLAIDFRDTDDTSFLLGEIRADFRAGFDMGQARPFLDCAVPYSPLYLKGRDRTHHAAAQYMLAQAVIACFSVVRSAETVAGAMKLPPVLLPNRPNGGLLVGLNIGSGHSAKNWPLSRFTALGRRLIKERGARIVLFGANPQEEMSAYLASALGEAYVENLVGKLSLPHVAAMMRGMDVFIGNDAGTTHLAAELGVPTVCLFGTFDPFASRGPIGARCVTVRSPESDLGLISADDAFAAVDKALAHGAGEGA